MVERAVRDVSRPKPGPRPRGGQPQPRPKQPRQASRRSAHGSSKRRVGADERRPRPARRHTAQQDARQRRVAQQPMSRQRPSEGVERPHRVREPLDPKTNRRWWALVVVLASAALVFAVFEAPTFAASRTQIAGNARTSEGAIAAALAITADQALITYDTGAAAERIEALPWIEAANVVRQWPNTVRVVVREHGVVAGVGDPAGQRWWLVGADRLAIESQFTPPAQVPLLVVDDHTFEAARPGAPIAGIERAYDLALSVPGQIDPWVSMWTLDDSGSVSANLIGSATAVFGPAGEQRTQFVSLASILGGGTALTCIDVIDLSTPDTPVIHRDQGCINASRALGS